MSIILLKQSPLAQLSSTNIDKNVLTIDGELSDLMSSMICDELSYSPHITCISFAGNMSPHSMQFILSKIVLINNISDVCFAQNYTVDILSLAMNALNSSRSKKTIWANITDIEQQKISALFKNSLVILTNEIWGNEQHAKTLLSVC